MPGIGLKKTLTQRRQNPFKAAGYYSIIFYLIPHPQACLASLRFSNWI
jgi:hypothetical protein